MDETVSVPTVTATVGSPILHTNNATGFASVAVGAVVTISGTDYTVASKQQDGVIGTTATAVGTTLTTDPGFEDGFNSVQVGAVMAHANYTHPTLGAGFTTVASKQSSNQLTTSAAPTPNFAGETVSFRGTLTLGDNVAAGAGSATRVFTGKEVEPKGFSRTFVMDGTYRRKNRIGRTTVKYAKATTGIKVAVARLLDASRTTDSKWTVMNIPAMGSGYPYGVKILQPPRAARDR